MAKQDLRIAVKKKGEANKQILKVGVDGTPVRLAILVTGAQEKRKSPSDAG